MAEQTGLSNTLSQTREDRFSRKMAHLPGRDQDGPLLRFYSQSASAVRDYILSPNIKSEMRSFKSNKNIHKKEGGSYYVVSANKASSVTL